MELKARNVPLISGHEASRILRMGAGDGLISVDLGLTYVSAVFTRDGLEVLGRLMTWETMREVAERPESIYLLEERPRMLSFYSGKYYRLIQPIWGHAPTVEINGIRMHRASGISPEEDASSKVSLMGDLRGKNVLDICTGLGYTTIEELRRGAEHVTTVESDPNVLELATYNPWSRPLFGERVELVAADITKWIESPEEIYDAVMLDPPTIRVAGQVYSGDFYRNLFKVIRKGGVLVHYVGEPGRLRGEKVYVGVVRRLREAGFRAAYCSWVRCVRALKV